MVLESVVVVRLATARSVYVFDVVFVLWGNDRNIEYLGIEKLWGADNWNVWKFAVRNLLRGSENAYEVCIGEIQKPNPLSAEAAVQQQAQYQEDLKVWDKADRVASQIIIKTLDTKIMAILVSYETARNMWLKLHTVFEQQTKQVHTVQSEFFSFSMDPMDDMVAHIAKFEGLVLRMQQLNVKPDELSLTVKLLDTYIAGGIRKSPSMVGKSGEPANVR